MEKLIGIVFLFLALVLNIGSARAAINTDCTSRGCVFVLTNTAGILAFYADDGTSAGSLTVSVGSGQGAIAADEGIVVWARTNSNNVWVYDAAAGGNPCVVNVGTSCGYGNAVVFGSHVYKGCGASVRKISISNCSNYVIIPITGSSTYSVAKDASTIYVLDAGGGTISTIVPPAETSSSFSIGRQGSDYLWSIVRVGENLYSSGAAGIYQIPLPLSGSSSLFQALPFITDVLATNGTYLSASASDGVAYLVPLSTPSSYISVGCSSCNWAALSDDTLYTVGGWTPDIGMKAWDFTGVQRSYSPLTTQTSYSVAYLRPTVTPPQCGDNIKNGSEVCDGADLDGKSCVTQGFDYGTLACAGDCMSLDTSGCHMNCGNGTIDTGEECDGSNLNSQTCVSLGFDTGTLACTSGCMLDTSGCSMFCGNGTIETPEECDGSNHNGATCVSLGFDGGTLNCSSSCAFITTSCVMDSCGNGTIDAGEDCDGSNLNGATCVSLGFSAGTLTCSPTSCTFDTTACVTYECGNGVQEPGEECDNGAANSDTEPDACREDCSNPRCGDGVTDTGEECDDGNLIAGDGCDENCNIEVIPPDCGNGVINTGEDCDGENLNGQSCVSLGLGFTGGTLACTTACAFNTSACVTETVCEWQQTVAEVVEITEQPELIGKALEIYTTNTTTLTRQCAFSCQDFGGGESVRVETSSYCNVRVQGPNWTATFHLYKTDSNGLLMISKETKKSAHVGGGRIMLHSGNNIGTSYGENEELGGATMGTSDIAEIRSSWNGVPGRWLLLWVTSGSMRYFETLDPTNTCTLPNVQFEAWIVINLDALGLLKDWEKQIPPGKKPSCNGCSQTSGNSQNVALMLVLLGLFLVWLRLRPLVRTKKIR